MWYLILQIILCLLVAFLLGYLLAKLLKAGSWKDAYEELKSKLTNMDNDLSSKISLLDNKLETNAEKLTNDWTSGIASLKEEYDPKFKEYNSMLSTLEGTLLTKISTNVDSKFSGFVKEIEEKDYDGKINSLTNDIAKLKEELKNKPEPKYYDDDLAKIKQRIDELQKMINDIPEAKFYDDDITQINSGLTELQSLLSNAPKPKYYDDDLAKLQQKIDDLQKTISQKPDAKFYDDDINNIWAQFTELKNSLNNIPSPKEYDSEISKLEEEIAKLKNMLNEIPKPKYYDEDINKHSNSIAELSKNFSSYYIKEDVDAKLKDYFAKWEAELNSKDKIIALLEKRIAKLEKKPKVLKNIKPDDLKRIKGVGKVLEKLLHKNGITTFKQVALFTNKEIDNLAEQLGSFHKRIRRDNWKGQAKILHEQKYGEKL